MSNVTSLTLCAGPHSPLPMLSYMTASVSGILCLITVPGNLLICMAVYYDPYRQLRTPFNIVVANLAFADLIVGCITEPLSMYLHVNEAIGRKVAILNIRALHLSYFISCTASVLSISLLALERYMSISYSLKYRRYFKVRRFVFVSLAVWLLAIGLSMIYFLTSDILYPFVFINVAVFWTLGVTTFCYVKILRKLTNAEKTQAQLSTVVVNANANASDENNPEIKASVIRIKDNATGSKENPISMEEIGMTIKEKAIATETNVLPIEENATGSRENSISIDENGVTVKKNTMNGKETETTAKKNTKTVEESGMNIKGKAIAMKENATRTSTTAATINNEYSNNKYNILVTKTYIIVSVMFLACYIPALMIIYTMNWCKTCSCAAIHILRDLQFLVVLVNSSVNPFLYAIRFAHFRRAILKILQIVKLDEIFH